MEVQLQELYFSEVDSGRLMYEDDPEYERRRQALSSCLDRLEVIRDPEARDLLWDAVLRFTDQSDLVSFAHGLRLGLCDFWPALPHASFLCPGLLQVCNVCTLGQWMGNLLTSPDEERQSGHDGF
ncbi:MAG: hypothetical protein EGQ81_02245 [Akkermansia sp.]|nr:hypothetical protein [Akkermansia sp.]